MADISGTYDFFEFGTKNTLVITDSNGNIEGTLGSKKISGSCPATNTSVQHIFFSTDPPDPRRITLNFYVGTVQIDKGTPIGMSGVHNHFGIVNPSQNDWFAVFTGPPIH
jgi:hypothetical protein